MSSVKLALESTQTPTKTYASLANGSGRACTAVDNHTNLDLDAIVHIKVKTGASGVSSTGYISVYLVKSLDGTLWDDGFGGSDAGFTPSAATFLFSFPAIANATTYQGSERLSKVLDRLPYKFSIAIVNNSGAALDSTEGNHSLTVAPDYLTVA
jgi:hypothetical protein